MTLFKTILLSMALLALPSVQASAQSCAPPPSGLIAWWDADDVAAGVATDLVGGIPGTLIGGGGTTAGLVGSNAFLLDGASRIDIGNPASLDPAGQAEITVDAWVMLTQTFQGNFRVFVEKRSFITGSDFQWTLALQGSASPLNPVFAVKTATGVAFAQSLDPLIVGAWHHVAGVYDGSNASLYVDGVLKRSQPLSGTIRSFPAGPAYPVISIGALKPPRALIDEVGIFNRGLSAVEIQAIYAAGSAGKCKEFDSDGDGLFDLTELSIAEGRACPSPSVADSDGDGLSDGDEVAIGSDPCVTDTDADGVPDGADPMPTVPGVTSGFIEDELRILSVAVVGNLDFGLIDAKNDNARAGRRNAMCNKINAAANAVAAGDYQDALDQIASLQQKLDGAPQPKDWMVDSPEKAAVFSELQLMVDLIALL